MMRNFLFIVALMLLTGMTLFADGGEGGVEAALVTFTDARAGYSIGHPGTWTQDTSAKEGIRFVGGDDSLTAVIRTLPAGLTVLEFAKKDSPTVGRGFTGFQHLYFKRSIDIRGAWILGFSADESSVVTGKAYQAHDERYYIPLSNHRVGLVTVTGPKTHYDRQGFRDIALTLKVSK